MRPWSPAPFTPTGSTRAVFLGQIQPIAALSTLAPLVWEATKAALRASYDRIKALIRETPEWSDERQIGGAIAAIVHTAYHLGEIRQALCVLKL